MKKLYSKISHEFIRKKLLLNADQRALYECLMLHADFTTGICWPSARTIMAETKISNGKRLKQAIFDLVDEDMIETWLSGQYRFYKSLDDVYSDG